MVDLNNKYDKLQKDFDEIKKYVYIKKKKIDIIEYLNLNYIEDCDISFNKFVEIISEKIVNAGHYEIKTKSGENRDFNNCYLNYIFEYNFINGITKIISEIIFQEREKKINIPIRSFNQKDELFILIVDDFNKKKWITFEYLKFKEFIICIHKKIINLFTIWQQSVNYKIKDEHFNNIYLDNMKKMLGQSKSACGLHGDIYLTIKNKLYKNLSENFKNLISFEIE